MTEVNPAMLVSEQGRKVIGKMPRDRILGSNSA